MAGSPLLFPATAADGVPATTTATKENVTCRLQNFPKLFYIAGKSWHRRRSPSACIMQAKRGPFHAGTFGHATLKRAARRPRHPSPSLDHQAGGRRRSRSTIPHPPEQRPERKAGRGEATPLLAPAASMSRAASSCRACGPKPSDGSMRTRRFLGSEVRSPRASHLG